MSLSTALKTVADVKKKVLEAIKVNKATIKDFEKDIKNWQKEAEDNRKNFTQYALRLYKIRNREIYIESLNKINELFEKYLEKPEHDALREAAIEYAAYIHRVKNIDEKKELEKFKIFKDGFRAGYYWLRDDLQPKKDTKKKSNKK